MIGHKYLIDHNEERFKKVQKHFLTKGYTWPGGHQRILGFDTCSSEFDENPYWMYTKTDQEIIFWRDKGDEPGGSYEERPFDVLPEGLFEL